MPRAYLQTPIGVLELCATQRLLRHVRVVEQAGPSFVTPLLERAVQELQEYFAGTRRQFDVPCCCPPASPFQIRVWDALEQIPYGKTVTYGALARQLGMPNAARAVGRALGANPLLIFRPCHRVVGARSVGGYAAGLFAKQFLLALEKNADTEGG